MKLNLTDDQEAEIIDTVTSYADGPFKAMREHPSLGLNLEGIRELMLDNGYDRCVDCGWYLEVSAFWGDDEDELIEEIPVCSQCRSYK